MKLKAVLALLLVSVLAAGVLSNVASAKPKKKKGPKSGPLVVGTDNAGDWGCNQDCGLAPLGDALGMDLTEATIEMADKSTVNFVIKLNSLPPSGGIPEFTRYTWDMEVDGEYRELDGKFTNYSRGICDPTAGCLTADGSPKDPGQQPFAVRGNCGQLDLTATTFTTCEELALVSAAFDAAAGTITIPVPLEALGAKPGSKIVPGLNIFGGSISATPSAWATSSAMPLDTLTATNTFVVSKK